MSDSAAGWTEKRGFVAIVFEMGRKGRKPEGWNLLARGGKERGAVCDLLEYHIKKDTEYNLSRVVSTVCSSNQSAIHARPHRALGFDSSWHPSSKK
jgi:hypothetical protein